MSGRHQPLNGADSADAYVLKRYRVLMTDRFDEDERHWVSVPAALGPHDAASQAREEHPGCSALKAEEVVPDSATFDEWMGWSIGPIQHIPSLAEQGQCWCRECEAALDFGADSPLASRRRARLEQDR